MTGASARITHGAATSRFGRLPDHKGPKTNALVGGTERTGQLRQGAHGHLVVATGGAEVLARPLPAGPNVVSWCGLQPRHAGHG